MTEVRIRDRYLSAVYRDLYSRHLEGERLGLQQLADQRTFPSTDPTSTQGERGCRTPLGTGVARPAAESKEGR